MYELHYSVTGLPQYYDDYDDYEDEEYSNSDETLDPVKNYKAKMRSNSERVEVRAGTTIRLSCHIDNLNSKETLSTLEYPKVFFSTL